MARLRRTGPHYLLRDTFSDTLAAGAVNGTRCDTGQVRTVADTEGKLSQANGVLVCAVGKTVPVYGDPRDEVGSEARVAGKVLRLRVTPTANNTYLAAGWRNITSGVVHGAAFHGLGYLVPLVNSAPLPGGLPNIRSYAAGETLELVVVLRAVGVFLLEVVSGSGKLLWASGSGNDTPLTAHIQNYNAAWTSDNWRVLQQRWMCSPLASDSFARADGALGVTNGAGHAETTGIGSGGAGKAWLGAGAISTNKLVITPTLGAELLTDGGLEGAYTAGKCDALIKSGSPTLAESADAHGGSKAQQFTAIAQFNSVNWANIIPTTGTWYQGSIWAKRTAGSKGLVAVGLYHAQARGTLPRITSATYVRDIVTFRAPNTNPMTMYAAIEYDTASYDTIIADDASIKPITLASMFSALRHETPDLWAEAAGTVTAGTQAGVVVRLDSEVAPANFLIAYHDGVNANLVKCVAGTYTSLIAAAATYAAGAKIQVMCDGTEVRLFYNGAAVGTAQTVADAGILNNTLHGLFSTYEGNTFSSFVTYARKGYGLPE